jgi:pimeloyl-ACP methyl ester carboxylesterase
VATFVLVHGAWHGGWCWRKLQPLLEREGHQVLTPTLTGLGDRAHLASPMVGLTTHIQDIVNTLVFANTWQVVLVGHGYGGMVISGVAGQLADQLSQLVYVDGAVPQPEQAFVDLLGPGALPPLQQLADQAGDGWRLPWMGGMFGVIDHEDVEWMEERLTAQPLATYTEPVTYWPALEHLPLRRTFIRTGSADPMLDATSTRLIANPAWQCLSLDAPHDAMIAAPQALARLLLDMV